MCRGLVSALERDQNLVCIRLAPLVQPAAGRAENGSGSRRFRKASVKNSTTIWNAQRAAPSQLEKPRVFPRRAEELDAHWIRIFCGIVGNLLA